MSMNGYNALAGYMGTYPSLAIFRRFLILHARDLLVMQGEIINLEHELCMSIQSDREAKDPVKNASEYDISALKGPHKSERAAEQWSRTLELRKLLKNYGRSTSFASFRLLLSLCEAQLRFASLQRLAPVKKADLLPLHECLGMPYGSGRHFLRAHEFETWDEEHIHDLASLDGSNTRKDALSKLIDKLLRRVYHPVMGRKLHDPLSVEEAWASHGQPRPIVYYPDGHVSVAIDTLSTILASVLPALSAFGLFFIQDPLIRMVAIVACTVLFSTILTLVARPTRAECFAITSAFAAVLVVFLGSNGSVP
ncbi:hypothetical protein A1O1_09017 [Capronia coronata CBS 617.96]|uniref:DUF6594 domain-containing protein n=1 Tax=Capronia coronata CBS 617.96 TaxID=1182541 RepID=W9XNS3_9EURO|nr:uncharacterized protein A1O1_09017 [Capronia coronata CBS 617.96]EXJ78616.1 hypothetical protein A1O1_09017 [Capronia coronata CBS 617.96]